MDLPINHFKRAIAKGQHQLGLWVTLANAYTTELVAGSGFDWLLLDTEHSPADLETVVAQMQAASRFASTHAVVRPAWSENVRIKRFLDAGAQTLLLPYIQNADEAAAAVAGMRYPPRGLRGVGGTTRASGFGRIDGYLQRCEEELCLLVQVETREALDNLDDILKVEGIDGVFIGPADLSASLGHLGNQAHPEVQSAIEDAIGRIRAAGKAPGILMTDEALARRYIELGSLFTAVGVDASILAKQTQSLAARFR